MEPSNLPATLTPDQTAIAAWLLKARLFYPIHYGQLDNPDAYRQQPDLDESLPNAAHRTWLNASAGIGLAPEFMIAPVAISKASLKRIDRIIKSLTSQQPSEGV
jgi:hypothetical protein